VLQEIILADITSMKERPLYLGLLAIPIVTGSISGPILGAVFSELIGWRWIGWINLPIVGISFVLAFFFLHLKPIEMSFSAKVRRLDWIGMVVFATGATATTLPLSWADSLYSWSSWRTILPLIIGLLVLAIFAVYEKKKFPSRSRASISHLWQYHGYRLPYHFFYLRHGYVHATTLSASLLPSCVPRIPIAGRQVHAPYLLSRCRLQRPRTSDYRAYSPLPPSHLDRLAVYRLIFRSLVSRAPHHLSRRGK